MNKNEIMSVLTNIMREVFELPDLQVEEKTSAHDVDEWNSLNHLTLISGIEKYFKVKFALGELMKLQNVGQMADLIIKKTTK